MKNKTTALLLSIFTGPLGIDRFYLGYTGIGILKLLTAGGFGILALIDIIRIATGSLQPADGMVYEEDVRNAAPVTTAGSNPYEDLTKLDTLHKNGVLTDEEYERKKAAIVDKL